MHAIVAPLVVSQACGCKSARRYSGGNLQMTAGNLVVGTAWDGQEGFGGDLDVAHAGADLADEGVDM
jgi:hypothetical protein